jgi:hypothetical protein
VACLLAVAEGREVDLTGQQLIDCEWCLYTFSSCSEAKHGNITANFPDGWGASKKPVGCCFECYTNKKLRKKLPWCNARTDGKWSCPEVRLNHVCLCLFCLRRSLLVLLVPLSVPRTSKIQWATRRQETEEIRPRTRRRFRAPRI